MAEMTEADKEELLQELETAQSSEVMDSEEEMPVHNEIVETRSASEKTNDLNDQVIKRLAAIESKIDNNDRRLHDWDNNQRTSKKEELTAALEYAKTQENMEDALNIKEQLLNMERQPSTATTNKGQRPVVNEFIKENPVLDPSSRMFDRDFMEDVSQIQRHLIDQMSSQGGADLKDNQINRINNLALKKAKELHPNIASSEKRGRSHYLKPTISGRPSTQTEVDHSALKLRLRPQADRMFNGHRNQDCFRNIYKRLRDGDKKQNIVGDKQIAADFLSRIQEIT